MCCNTAPNHGQGWYEVIGTDTSIDFISPEGFEKWCKPFFESNYNVLSKIKVAGDEHFKTEPDFWTKPPYNLPALKERWFQIMDDEQWWVYTLQEK